MNYLELKMQAIQWVTYNSELVPGFDKTNDYYCNNNFLVGKKYNYLKKKDKNRQSFFYFYQ